MDQNIDASVLAPFVNRDSAYKYILGQLNSARGTGKRCGTENGSE